MISNYMEKLTILKSKVNDKSFFNGLLNLSETDIDTYLDHRESKGFDQNWMMAFEEVNEKQSAQELPVHLIDDIREVVFKKVYSITKNGDLASYCSDDFELISKNLCFDKPINFVSIMQETYHHGELPK